MKNKLLLRAVLLLVFLCFTFSCFKKKNEEAYVYDMESLKKIPQELLHYQLTAQSEIMAEEPGGITIGPGGNIFVSCRDSVLIFNTALKSAGRIKTGAGSGPLVVSKDEFIYIGAGDHIEIYDFEGSQKESWTGLGDESIITSLVLAGDALYIADAGNRGIFKFDRQGKLLGIIDGVDSNKKRKGFILPSAHFDAAADALGNLWVVNPGARGFEKYSSSGKFISGWYKNSAGIEGFNGCCNPVNIALTAEGFFVTAEKGLLRIKVYDNKGGLLSVVAGPGDFGLDSEILDLAVDDGGAVFVLDITGKTLKRFDKKISL